MIGLKQKTLSQNKTPPQASYFLWAQESHVQINNIYGRTSMKLSKYMVAVAGVLILIMAGCNTDQQRMSNTGWSSPSASGDNYPDNQGYSSDGSRRSSGTSSTGSTGSTASTGGSTAGSSTGSSYSGTSSGTSSDTGAMPTGGSGSLSSAGNPSASSTQVSYGTVQSVEQVSRQDAGTGTLGAMAAGGSIGSPTDRVYRISVSMDDSSKQTVILDSMPNFKAGDRVRYSNGELQRY